MSLDEQLTVVIMYHSSYAKNFKYFYKTCIEYIHKDDFPNALSYNRFIALMPRLFMPLNILVHTLLGKTKQVLILLILPQLTIISVWLCFAMILSLLFFQMRVKTWNSKNIMKFIKLIIDYETHFCYYGFIMEKTSNYGLASFWFQRRPLTDLSYHQIYFATFYGSRIGG